MNDEITINSNVSPLEMMELNKSDAKKMNLALGIILEEMPGKIAYIKNKVDEAETKINSLKEVSGLGFDITGDVERLAKDYDTFAQETATYAGYYELEIIRVIDFFGRQNSIDGSFDFDNDFFNSVPYLITIMATILNYSSGNSGSTQLTLDAYNIASNDFISMMGNASYNIVEMAVKKWNDVLRKSAAAAGALIFVESLYDLLYVHKDPSQQPLIFINASGNGIKLILDNAIAEYIAVPAGKCVSAWVTAKFAGGAVAKFAGGAVGGIVGVGIVVVGGYAIDSVVTPVVKYLQGEDFISGTSIPRNGGGYSLFTDYVRTMKQNSSGYGPLGRTTSLYGMTVSSQYCKELLQQDPIDTVLGLDNFNFSENNYSYNRLNAYINALKNIPKDCANFNEQVKELTDKWVMNTSVSNGDHVSDKQYDYIQRIIDMGFDPYTYAMNNN